MENSRKVSFNWATSWQNQQNVVRPAKTQISLGIRPVLSESSLFAWRKLGSLATHWAHSEDSDQTERIDLSLHLAHMSFCWFCLEVAHLSILCVYGNIIGTILLRWEYVGKDHLI